MIFLTVYYTSGLRKTGHDTGDWSNGMIGVSKTFGGSSILSSPAMKEPKASEKSGVSGSLALSGIQKVSNGVSN